MRNLLPGAYFMITCFIINYFFSFWRSLSTINCHLGWYSGSAFSSHLWSDFLAMLYFYSYFYIVLINCFTKVPLSYCRYVIFDHLINIEARITSSSLEVITILSRWDKKTHWMILIYFELSGPRNINICTKNRLVYCISSNQACL